jgi:hypothetical protein
VSRLMTEVEAETCVSRPNLPRAESKNMRQLEKFGSLCSSTTETWERMLTVWMASMLALDTGREASIATLVGEEGGEV